MSDLERTKYLQEKPWEKAMRERNERERKMYLEEADRFRATAAKEKAQNDPKMQQALLKAAADLERFARTMPRPKSRRQTIVEKAKMKVQESTRQREADNGPEL